MVETPQSTGLYLTKEVFTATLNNQHPEIIYVKDNPRRFLMKGDPLPPFGFAWLAGGLVAFIVFLYSLKLR